MTHVETIDREDADSLYVTGKEIARRFGFGEKFGYRVLRRLARGVPNMRPYPQPDPMFDDRWFWPEVLQWHLDYHRVRAGASPRIAPDGQPRWEENFNALTSQ